MSFLTTNYNNNNNNNNNSKDNNKTYTPIETGDYEAKIIKATEKYTTRGKKYLYIELLIRNDVQQNFKNQHAFLQYWRRKNTGQYALEDITAIAKAAGVPDNTDFQGVDDYCQAILNKNVNVHIVKEAENYNGRHYINNRVFYTGWSKSKIAEKEIVKDTINNHDDHAQEIIDNAVNLSDKTFDDTDDVQVTKSKDPKKLDTELKEINNNIKDDDELSSNSADEIDLSNIRVEDLPF